MEQVTIAIDGPASSGKSSVAKLLAQELGYIYVDTGAMYRSLTLFIIEKGINYKDEGDLLEAISACQISFEVQADQQIVRLNGRDVTKAIRSQVVNSLVSEVSAIPTVREALVAQQQAIAHTHNVVMDGRDIGTVVLPHASHKFFFTASSRIRAERRYKENYKKGLSNQTLSEIEAEIIERDNFDRNRQYSPLKQAPDAQLIDTEQYTLEQLVAYLLEQIRTYCVQ